MKLDVAAPVRVVTDLLFRNLGLKLLALVMTAILFVSTRDDVSRSFEVPLRVIPDPDRVLVTELPEVIQVKVRGPWTRLNRLQDYDFEAARFDLREAAPGPLGIDEGAIVMPPGVVFSDIEYDHVDLRFEEVVTAKVDIEVPIRGRPPEDFEITKIDSAPAQWTIRGGETEVRQVQYLETETVDVSGAQTDVVERKAIIRPDADVTLVESGEAMPQVNVLVRIAPVQELRPQTVPVAVPEGLDPIGVIPETYEVELSGPKPAFRVLENLGITLPIEAEVVPLKGKSADGGRTVEVRFGWADAVPPEVRSQIAFDHGVERLVVPSSPGPSPSETPTSVERPI